MIDEILGIRTDLADYDWSRRGMSPCQPSPELVLKAVAERIAPNETAADCGCGTGRAVFALAFLAKCCAIGIELDERRYRLAEQNLKRCERTSPDTAKRVRFLFGAAQEVLPCADVYYFFNPFPAAVLRGVLKRINARKVRLMCYYPSEEWENVLLSTGWTRTESVRFEALGKDERERLDVWER